MNELINSISYADWLKGVKERIRVARIKVTLAANSELLNFYWDLGKMMVKISKSAQWGNNWVNDMFKDLRKEFPDMEGFQKPTYIISDVCINFTRKMNFSTSLVEKFKRLKMN